MQNHKYAKIKGDIFELTPQNATKLKEEGRGEIVSFRQALEEGYFTISGSFVPGGQLHDGPPTTLRRRIPEGPNFKFVKPTTTARIFIELEEGEVYLLPSEVAKEIVENSEGTEVSGKDASAAGFVVFEVKSIIKGAAKRFVSRRGGYRGFQGKARCGLERAAAD